MKLKLLHEVLKLHRNAARVAMIFGDFCITRQMLYLLLRWISVNYCQEIKLALDLHEVLEIFDISEEVKSLGKRVPGMSEAVWT